MVTRLGKMAIGDGSTWKTLVSGQLIRLAIAIETCSATLRIVLHRTCDNCLVPQTDLIAQTRFEVVSE